MTPTLPLVTPDSLPPALDGGLNDDGLLFARRQVLSRRWFFWPVVLASLLLVTALLMVLAAQAWRIAVPFAVATVLWFAVLWRQRQRFSSSGPSTPLRVTATHVDIPRGKATDTVALDALTSCELRVIKSRRGTREGATGRELAVLSTAEGVYPLAALQFAEPNGMRAYVAAIHQRLQAPERVAQRERMAVLTEHANAFWRRRPVATWVWFATVAVLFTLTQTLGFSAGDGAAQLVRFGANVPVLVHEGQWWRLAVAGFLHVNFVHFAMNAAAIVSTGAMLERTIGRSVYISVVVLSGVGGNLLSAATSRYALSAGASSALFGVLAALLVVNVRYGNSAPVFARVPKSRWLSIIVLNVMLSLLPGIDAAAHVGGAAVGACVALVMFRGSAQVQASDRRFLPVAWLLLLATVLAVGVTFRRAFDVEETADDLERTAAFAAALRATASTR